MVCNLQTVFGGLNWIKIYILPWNEQEKKK